MPNHSVKNERENLIVWKASRIIDVYNAGAWWIAVYRPLDAVLKYLADSTVVATGLQLAKIYRSSRASDRWVAEIAKRIDLEARLAMNLAVTFALWIADDLRQDEQTENRKQDGHLKDRIPKDAHAKTQFVKRVFDRFLDSFSELVLYPSLGGITLRINGLFSE